MASIVAQITPSGTAEVTAADRAAAGAVAQDAAEVTAADRAAADAVAQGAAEVTAASISMAEARVLGYLPTALTFALIADKLGISRSAAKERAERAYKKLGFTAAPRQSAGPVRSGSSSNR